MVYILRTGRVTRNADSLQVILPKSWTRNNQITAGDEIIFSVDVDNDGLRITRAKDERVAN